MLNVPASVVKKAATKALSELNEEFQANFNTSFEKTILQIKNVEQRKIKVDVAKQMKKKIEDRWKETSILRFV